MADVVNKVHVVLAEKILSQSHSEVLHLEYIFFRTNLFNISKSMRSQSPIVQRAGINHLVMFPN